MLWFPITVLYFAVFLLGLGNLLSNEAYVAIIDVNNEFILLIADCMVRIGTFLIAQFPLLFLIRLSARKAGSATTMISAVSGYIAFLVVTMYFGRQDLPASAYSSILGLSMTTAGSATVRGGVHYPLQTGVIATAVVAVITQISYSRSRNRSEYSFFSFISRDTWCVIRTVILSGIAGLAVTYVWPYAVNGITRAMDYIARDTTNPVNLVMYGVLERFLGVLNLGTLIRSPFWYGTSGGSWISMAGTNIAGDVNIWTAQLEASAVNGMAGRFITPYYVINIFAVPGMLWALHSLQTDRLERRRMVMFYVITTIMSIMSGTLLPLELSLILLCPLLFFIHISYMGILYGVFHAMHIYLGFNYHGTSTLTAMPGTLFEYLSYFQNSALSNTLVQIMIVGGISFVLYFLITRFYFKRLALDLFHTGYKDEVVQGTIEAIGGIENIKMTNSSIAKLTLSVYDPGKVDVQRLRRLGSHRIYENRAGFNICFGAPSTMIRLGIDSAMRDAVREVNRM
jgi:phosphotransferase system  glucose/maltose/N-acetylglucosamine-specific IIC component